MIKPFYNHKLLLFILLPIFSQIIVVKAASKNLKDAEGTANLLRSQLPDDFYEEIDEDDDEDTGGGGGGLLFDNEAIANWKLGLNSSTPRIQCHSCEPPDCSHPTICIGAVRCYTSHVRDTDGTEMKSKGCTKTARTALMYCSLAKYNGWKVHEENGESAQYAFDCCNENLCNNGTQWPELPDVPVLEVGDGQDVNSELDVDSLQMSGEVILAVALPIVALVLLVAIISGVMRRCHRKRMEKLATTLGLSGLLERGDATVDELVGLRAQVVGDSTLREFHNDDNMTSGSGSGMPHLVPRTLAKMIELGERIGKGRYGEVWRGRWNGDSVAVKIFFSREEDSWKRETNIYTTVLLRHENILGYIGSDCTSQNSCTQLWLVTHFYAKGSLYDYLNLEFGGLTSQQAYKIIMSSLNGIVHLHTEIFGTQGKPSIAHRDIKSKNILVKDDGSCVIADFGLAVTHSEQDGRLDEQQNSRVGTKRYMSPEVLDQSIDRQKNIEAYRRVDVYAFALVMWEVMRRTRVCDIDPDSAEPYALPFSNDVGPDPSFEEMKKVVCIDNRRPEFVEAWAKNPFTLSMWRLMEECWHENAVVRLPTLRIKKSLAKLQPYQNEQSGQQPYTCNKFVGISQN